MTIRIGKREAPDAAAHPELGLRFPVSNDWPDDPSVAAPGAFTLPVPAGRNASRR